MKITFIFVLTSTLVLAKPNALEKKAHDEKPDRTSPNALQFFNETDQDQNGVIDLAEFSANPRLTRATSQQKEILFRRLDKNRDQTLSQQEIKPVQNRARESRNRPPRWLRGGPVNYETFVKQPRIQKLTEEKRRRLFERLDRDGDGLLSKKDSPRSQTPKKRPSELPSPGFQRVDSDQNGKISFSEFRKRNAIETLKPAQAKARFQDLDRNGDGSLDASEYPRRPAEQAE